MSDDIHASLGEIKGLLIGTKDMLREHIDQDTRRFDSTFKRLDALDADVNQAKGAKSTLVWLAGGVGAAASFAAWAFGKLFNLH